MPSVPGGRVGPSGPAYAACVVDKVAAATTAATPTARQRRVSRVIRASTPRSRSVRGAFTQRTRASCAIRKYWPWVVGLCADRARWASLRGERRLVGTNAGYGVILVLPDS